QPPLMTSTLCSASAEGAMRRAVEAARAAEADGMLAVSVLPGFSLADIPAPCISVVVVGDGDRAAADAVAARIARQIWEARDAFVYRSAPLPESVAQAAALARGAQRPVLMLDHGDNCMSGGPCDTMDVLEEALAQRLDGIVSGPLCDPDAVAQLIAAGVGATVTVPVGNKRPSHGGVQREPFVATGIVRALTDGEYVITGPTYTGQRAYMGRTAVFDIGAATLVISERTQEPWDLGVFESVGIDPRRARFLLLKSRMYCRPVFVPIAAALVECDSRGVTSSDYALFRYARLARPVYPLDAIDRWAPAA
ncbi:MlrC C-terminal domain-containing protein, partial [Burkholderia multivorans]